MKTYGLTGGIGMGKSTCADLLRARGISVIDTDDVARELVQPSQPALEEIIREFGNSTVDQAGQLRRQHLAALVFQDSDARRKLEAILHPKITAVWQSQLNAWQIAGIARAVVVIPLLFETAAESTFQETVCVACSPATQLLRLSARGWSKFDVDARSAAQLPVEQKLARANRVIWSEGSMDSLSAQVARVFAIG